MIKHGLSKTIFNSKWYGINQRCNNSKSTSYKRYGKVGIKCLWNNFDEFIKDMYVSYNVHVKKFGVDNTTIDRINSRGHYCKENCRWATYSEQNFNKRNSRKVIFKGEERPITEWARILNIRPTIIFNRIHRGWEVDKALSTPDTSGKHI